jgi:acetoin utilization deacetylase AcuC-like enzyme
VSELLMIEQRRGRRDAAPWIVEGGRRRPGMDDHRRVTELRSGLTCHSGVRPGPTDAAAAEVELTLASLHEPNYLEALDGIRSDEPVVMPHLAAPGLPPDIPVCAGLVASAREGVRTSITAATRILAGARFTYALCRPPGHHAGPDWCAGYCYLNTAAAAAFTLCEGGLKPVGILDLDLHYPNGTAAIVASMSDAWLYSIHAHPVTNVADGTVTPSNERERVVELSGSPEPAAYLRAVGASIEALGRTSEALVVSLGYDTVIGDPHGSWSFSPAIFAQVGRLLAAARLPVCVIQEGGYALGSLAACSYAFAAGLLDEAAAPAGMSGHGDLFVHMTHKSPGRAA